MALLTSFGIPAGLAAQGEGLASRTLGEGLGLLEAVEITLANHPRILIAETSVEAARGGVMVESGIFDPLVDASLSRNRSDSPSSELTSTESDGLAGSVGSSWQLRSGRSLESSIALDWLDVQGSVPSAGTNTASVSFTLRQPLLRGRRAEAVVGGERAAERELEGTRFDLAHAAASTLRDMVSQYWRVRAAMIDLEVLRGDESRSRDLLDQTRRLVEAQLTPAADLLQLEADLISVEANRIEGELLLFQERRLLAEAMGLGAEDAERVPLPDEPLPELGADAELPTASALLAIAYQRRGDLLASRERLASAELRWVVAEDSVRPRLDLVLTPSYEGLVDGNDLGDWVSPLWSNVPGASVSLGIGYAWPVGNQAAEGARIQAEMGVRQRRLEVEELRQDIGSRVPIALRTVSQTILTLERREQAIDLFEKIVDNELKKLRAGQSTLLDLIAQQDRLVSSQQSRVRAQLALALALLDLRFETGTLVDFDPSAATSVLDVSPADFITPPTPR